MFEPFRGCQTVAETAQMAQVEHKKVTVRAPATWHAAVVPGERFRETYYWAGGLLRTSTRPTWNRRTESARLREHIS